MKTCTERFKEKYTLDPTTECWLWEASVTSKGYGIFSYLGKKARAHRVSYELFIGAIPKELCVCHKCDNPSCVNPEHLFLGTNQDNVNDRVAKGRSKPVRGEGHGQAKLTEEAVLSIYKDVRKHSIIGEAYGVSRGTVSRIKRGERWRHLTLTIEQTEIYVE